MLLSLLLLILLILKLLSRLLLRSMSLVFASSPPPAATPLAPRNALDVDVAVGMEATAVEAALAVAGAVVIAGVVVVVVLVVVVEEEELVGVVALADSMSFATRVAVGGVPLWRAGAALGAGLDGRRVPTCCAGL